MSRYTTQLKFLVEYYTPELEGERMKNRINSSLPKIFDFDYPIWDESYKEVLERKIVMRYLMKEICITPVEVWKLFLEERLNSIMPYYIERYKTVQKEFDWLIDMENTDEYNSNSKREDVVNNVSRETSSNSSNTNSTTILSDMPQSTLNGMDYASNSQQDEGAIDSEISRNLNGDTTATNKQDESNKRVRKGLSGSRSKTQLNLEYRNSLINIDEEIVKELYDLFLLVY